MELFRCVSYSGKWISMPSYSWFPSKYIQHQNGKNVFPIFSVIFHYKIFFSGLEIVFGTHPCFNKNIKYLLIYYVLSTL